MPSIHETLGWLLPFLLLMVAIVVVPLRILDEQGLPRYRALRSELSQVEATNRRIHREVRELERDVETLRGDLEAIERIARDELGMIKPGEVLFQF